VFEQNEFAWILFILRKIELGWTEHTWVFDSYPFLILKASAFSFSSLLLVLEWGFLDPNLFLLSYSFSFFSFFLRPKRKCCWRLVTVCLEGFQHFSWGHLLQTFWVTEKKTDLFSQPLSASPGRNQSPIHGWWLVLCCHCLHPCTLTHTKHGMSLTAGKHTMARGLFLLL
jgi:hypothetical protein